MYLPQIYSLSSYYGNSTIWPTLEIVRFVQFEELVRKLKTLNVELILYDK